MRWPLCFATQIVQVAPCKIELLRMRCKKQLHNGVDGRGGELVFLDVIVTWKPDDNSTLPYVLPCRGEML
jgi:hypothetical protein